MTIAVDWDLNLKKPQQIYVYIGNSCMYLVILPHAGVAAVPRGS